MLTHKGMHLRVIRGLPITRVLLPRAHRQVVLTARRAVRLMAASGAGQPELGVHAATPQELASARKVLEQTQLAASRGASPEETQYCTLRFDQAPQGDSRPPQQQGAGRQPGSSSFDVGRYFGALETSVLGRLVLAAGALTSTQTVIQDNVAAVPDGALCVADRQIGGKGRGGNRWDSPEGCLMFSVCKRLELPGQRLPFVQYLVSLSAVQAIQQEAQQRLQGGTVGVRIKWPNDLYAGHLKLGGVLCHSSYRNNLFYVIMGVGLNVSNRQPTTCVDELIAAEAAARGLPPPVPVAREVLLAGMMNRLESMLGTLRQQGFAPLEQDYYQAWLHSGQEVQLEEVGRLVQVTVRGLSQQGYLEASDERGERYELHPDGNSFDFFKGLVRKKIG